MATLTPTPKQQFLDANGNPLAGGKLYSYQAGTTTPLATYTDESGGTPNANPVILNSRGEASVWLGTSTYKFKLTTSADVEIWTVDNISSNATFAASSGSSLVGFLQSGTGATARTVQAKLRDVVSVQDFGATGNGVTDDTAAIQAALNYLSTLPAMTGAQGKLFFPRGAYVFSSTLNIPANTHLIGEGVNFATALVPTASFTGSQAVKVDGTTATGGYAFRITIENITLNCTNFPSGRVPVLLQDCYTIGLRNVYLYNGKGTALVQIKSNATSVLDITLDSCHIFGANTTDAVVGVDIQTGSQVRLLNCDVENTATGVKISGSAKVALNSLYAERNIQGVDHQGTAGSLTILSPHVLAPNAGSTCVTVRGDNCTIIGGRLDGNGGTNGIRTADATTRPQNFVAIGVNAEINDPKSWLPEPVNYDGTNWYTTLRRNYKVVSDAVATTFYTITVPFTATHQAMFDMDVNARDNSGYTQWTAKYRFSCNNVDGTVRCTPVTEYAKATAAASGNYSLAITVAATVVGSTVQVQITGDSGGALGNGQSPRIATEAKLVQYSSDGSVYMVAN